MLRKKMAVAACCFLTTSTLLAASTNNTPQQEPWKFHIAPYIWAMNMNGRVGVGNLTSHVSENFQDLLNKLEGGGMLYLDASKGKFDIFLNSVYAVLGQDSTVRNVKVTATNRFGLFTGGVSYQVWKKDFKNLSEMSLEPYLGVRYTLNNTNVKIGPFSLTDNQNWYDPLVGLKLNYLFTKKWISFIAGDVGGTNFNSHNSYNLNGYIGYKPTSFHDWVTVFAGYRYLYQNYKTGSGRNRYVWDMRLFGPALGISVDV
jgi:hypothetical protein